jgi:flagellar protein FlbD
MVTLTRLNGTPITLNALLIEVIEETPDTHITMTTGKKIIVLEKVPVVVSLIQNYMQSIAAIKAVVKCREQEGS